MTLNGGTNREVKLRVNKLSLNFGGLSALSDISFDIIKKEIVVIIGPNGAGKTALLNCISGFYKPQKGEIYFNGQEITRMRPDKIAGLGISRTFQNIELYTGLNTQDNIMAARHVFMKQNFISSALFFGWAQKEEIRHRKIVEEIISFLEMQQLRKEKVGVMPYGMRKRVELARALALEPQLLLLDEPLAGMNQEEKAAMVQFILDIFEGQKKIYSDANILKNGVKDIILIEHDMGIMDIANRVIVLDFGRKIADGTPDEIKNNPEVIEAYLGEKR